MTLYELTEEFHRLYEIADGDDPEALKDTLDLLEGDLEEKIDSYVAVCRLVENDIDFLGKEEARIKARKTAKANNLKAIKERMQLAMDSLGKTKIQTALNTVSIQKNGGRLPVVLDVSPDDLPDSLVRIKKDPDTDAIRKYLDDGNTEYAHYGERGRSLRIR